jgi:hypothetical protein
MVLPIIIILILANSAHAATWYVSSNATGTNTGTSWANAWTSLSAISGVHAGDTVYISGGPAGSSRTYSISGTWSPTKGSSGSPITYQIGQDALHDGTAIFKGSGTWLSASSYQIISGNAGDGKMHFSLSGYNTAASIGGTIGLKLSYINFSNTLGDGIDGQNVTSFQMDHDYAMVSTANSDHFFSVGFSGTTWNQSLIFNNTIYVPHQSGASADGADAFQIGGNGYSFYNNTVVGYDISSYSGGQHQDGIQTLTASYVRVYGNTFQNIGNFAFFGDAYYGCFNHLRIYNNLFLINGDSVYPGGAIIGTDGGYQGPSPCNYNDVLIAGNLGDGYPAGQAVIALNNHSPFASTYTNDTIADNTCINSAGCTDTSGDSTANVIDNVALSSSQAASMFVSYSVLGGPANNYHLKSSASSLIGKGANLYQYFTLDRSGNPRPQTGAWDVGPYVYSSSGQSSTTSLSTTSSTSISTTSTTSISTTSVPTTSTTSTTTTTTTTTSVSTTSTTVTTTIFQTGSTYVPVTITNNQGSATGANFQQMVSFNPSTYTAYEAADLGNIRFVQGSTELYSWCESGCTSSSTNAVFWVKVPSVPSGSNIKINMSFQSTATHYDGVFAGEAPQLSSTYAQYDNGANVFNSLYQNFKGTSTPSGWTLSGSGAVVSSGLTITYSTSVINYALSNANYGLNSSQIEDAYADIGGSAAFTDLVVGYTNTGEGSCMGWTLGTTSSGSTITNFADINCAYTDYSSLHGSLNPSNGAWHIFTTYWPSSSSSTFSYDYGAAQTQSSSIPSAKMPVGVYSYSGNSQSGATTIRWVRLRTYPPSGVMPSVSFGALQTGSGSTTTSTLQTTTTAATTTSTSSTTTTSSSSTSVTVPTTTIISLSIPTAPSVSATKLDIGQTVTFTTYVSNGVPPYTYNFIISTTGGAIVVLSGPQSSNSVSYPTSTAGSLRANVIVTDNELSPETGASAYSSTFTVNSAPTANFLTPSTNSIILGQGVTFNVLLTGGTGPFLLKLTASNGIAVNTLSAGAGTVTFGTVFPQFNPSIYNVVATDTGTTSPFAFSSGQSSVAVSNAPTSISTTIPTTTTSTSTLSTSSSSAASTSAATTTASQQGGSGPGGAPGGGSGLPTVLLNGSCYTISNYSQKNTETFTLNGVSISSAVNFIGPTDAGVTVNGRIYASIVQGQNYSILNNQNYTYTMSLLNLSYLPVEHTVQLGFCSAPSANVTQSVNNTLVFNSGGNVTDVPIVSDPVTTPSFGFWPGNLSITNNRTSNTPIYVNVSKVTTPLPKLPPGYLSAVTINVTVNKRNLTNNSVYTTLGFDCAINSSRVAPFILQNGTWAPITPFTINKNLCTVTFKVPSDPVVALLIQNQPASTTSVATTTVPQRGAGAPATVYLVISGLILAIIAAVLIGIYVKRKRGQQGGPKVDPNSQKQTAPAAEGSTQQPLPSGNSDGHQIPADGPGEGIPPA